MGQRFAGKPPRFAALECVIHPLDCRATDTLRSRTPSLASIEHLRLGFVSGRAAHDNGHIWSDAGLGRLIDALRERAGSLTVALSASDEPLAHHEHRLSVEREAYIPLPPMPSYARGVRMGSRCRDGIRRVESRSDVVVVQLPFTAPTALFGAMRPRVYHVCADIRAIVSTSPYYQGLLRLPVVAAAQLTHLMQRSLAAQPAARVVTNGADLLSQFDPGRGRAVVSSSLYDREILSVPRQRSPDAPFRVLFVGFLRPEKGIDTLLAAFQRLLDEIPSAELFIVGAKAPVERGVSTELEQALGALRERGTVHMAGFHGYGPELFQAFADADVLAVPSRSEGTPRVLVEARAFGCTVVASNVGGIPTSIEHEVDGLLVPPGDAEALAAAFVRIARDRALRKRLIAAGIERARRTTVDRFADSIIAEAHLAADAGARTARGTRN